MAIRPAHPVAALSLAAVALLAAGCSSAAASTSAPANSASVLRAADHQTFASVAEITKKSALVVRGHVTARTVDLGPESTKGSTAGSFSRTGCEVVVDTLYKGAPVTRLWVSTPAASVHLAEPVTQYTPGEQVVLFLNDPHITKDGLTVHATWGLDQGHVTLTGTSGALRPTGHRDSLPLPATLDELEKQIRAAA